MLVTFLVFAVIAILCLIAILFYLYPGRKRPSTVPGMDPSEESTGNLGDISEAGSLHQFLCHLHETYGPIASFWFGSEYCVSIANADLFKSAQVLFDRPKVLFEFCLPLIGAKSIQFANGQDGVRRHKRYAHCLSHQACVNLLPDFNEICHELSKNWSTLPSEEHVPLHDYMMALAIKMITKTQFGSYFKSEENMLEFHKQYESIMHDLDCIMTGDLPDDDTVRHKSLTEHIDKFKDIIRDFVKVQKKAREAGDYQRAPVLDTLIDHVTDEEELVGDATAICVGGFHTTGNFLTWGFYYLAMYPEMQERVYDEVISVLGHDRDPTEEDLPKLEYLFQFMRETLRVSVTGPFAARVCQEREISIGGHIIPAGTPIITALGVSLSDQEYFNEPKKFNPDNFSPSAVKKRPNLAFSPFGIGQRKCLGYQFSYFEAYAAFCCLVRKFELSLAFDNDFYIEPKFGFVTKPETEIWIQVKPRSKRED